MADSRFLLRIMLRAFVVLLFSAPLVLFLLALQTQPENPPAPVLNAGELSQIEQLIVDNAPADIGRSARHSISLNQDQLNLLSRYALDLLDLDADTGGNIILESGVLHTELSIPLWGRQFPAWFNLSADFSTASTGMALDGLQLGLIRIPPNLVSRFLGRIQEAYLEDNPAYLDLVELSGSISQVQVQNGQLEVELLWEPELIARITEQARYYLISASDQQRILRHYRMLAGIVAAVPETTRAISLNSLLIPLFAGAAGNAGTETDPVAENRTLFLTIAQYVNDEDIEQLLGPVLAKDLPRARQIEVRVQRRQDLARHVASSAAISASAGAGLAGVLSSTKEAYDARYRSGYSFSDITANTAGVALGTLSTASAQRARIMQQRLASLHSETDYLPVLDNAQDGLAESDFEKLYGDNETEFRQRVAGIENLVYGLPLFLGLQ